MKEKLLKALLLEPVHPVLPQLLKQHSINITEGDMLSSTQLINELKDTTILIVRSKKVDATLIDCAPHLQIIGRAGSGLENIDVQYAQSKGIVCLNSPEGNRDAVGEHAIGMLLMLLNQLKKADNEVRQNIWDRKSNWGIELKGQTVGIIGYGNTGSTFAKKLSGFECDILVYDKYKNAIRDNYVRQASMQDIYEKADIVSLHLPLTKETYCLANDEFFSAFKKNIYFINTARGKIVNTSSLVKAMRTGKVKGACLDVIEYEESNFENLNKVQSADFEYLKQSFNVVLTPHIAGWTHQSYEKICRILAEKIVQYLK